jgi:ribose transport system substrate-binding protein
MKFWKRAALASFAALMAAASLAQSASAEEKRHKIYLSMSYIGNDWQAEAANMLKAMAASKDYRDRVDLKVQVAGPNAQKQIQQINAMVQAGAEAIIVYPISPTALNEAVKAACAKGVTIVAYDSVIEEPCAYNVHIDQAETGRSAAQWLVDKLGGKGKIVMITGVPGTSVDTLRNKAAHEVFAKYPDIKIVAETSGMWTESIARSELSKIVATHGWDTLDGLWMQIGCYTANSMQLEAGRPEDKVLPCAGDSSNGFRVQMLPKDTKVAGANGTYRSIGASGISAASPEYTGAYAVKIAVDVLDGKKIDKTIVVPGGRVVDKDIKLCETGSWEEMKAGCNVFQAEIVPNPGWSDPIFSPDLPQVGLNAALTGTPEE